MTQCPDLVVDYYEKEQKKDKERKNKMKQLVDNLMKVRKNQEGTIEL